MRRRTRPLAVMASLALAATGVIAGAASASADTVTRCIGTAGEVTVAGDLVVPADRTCVLEGTTVHGDVLVRSGANLVATDATFSERVVVNGGAFFDATDTTVGGNLVNNGAYGIYLDGTEVEGNYLGRATEDSTFFYSTDAAIQGRLEAVSGDVYLESTEVGRWVNTEGTTYTDVIDSTIDGELTVAHNPYGASICASEVDGTTTYIGNGGVQAGPGLWLTDCEEINYFGADVTISESTGQVDLSGSIIRGDLSGTDNETRPTGSDNRIRGEAGEQFKNLRPASDISTPRFQEDDDVRTPDRVRTDRDDRRADAIAHGADLGPAGL